VSRGLSLTRSEPESSACDTGSMSWNFPGWASELAWLSEDDRDLPLSLDGVNLVLNRARLAAFLSEFAEDKDVRDFLALDLLGTTAGLPLSSTGLAEEAPGLASRPFRLWEYVWLYKVLGLSGGGMKVLDLGGPATHLSVLAAIAGCHVTSVDINPEFVEAANECAHALRLPLLTARLGDMRDLSQFPAESFDLVISCSVLEHLTDFDQATALQQIARVLKPAGLVGLTFDYGPPAPGANEHLPPPHDPPGSAAIALRRYSQGGLVPAGNSFSEDAIPGSLFRHDSVRYTVASLFLTKAGQRGVEIPRCELAGSALGHLVIRDLPYRVYKGIERSGALIDGLRGTAACLESTATERLAAMQDRDREIQAREQRIAALESTATERLAAMQDRDREIQAREQRIAALESTATERLAAMQDRDREIQAREQRIAALESTATERLAAMQDRDREIQAREQCIAALESTATERLAAMQDRDREIQAREQRIAALESTAAERLAAMQDRDREIQAREQRIAALESTAAERLAAMQDRDREIQAREQRIAELESTAAERLVAMQDRDLLISGLQTALERRNQAIQEIACRADALESAADERLAAMIARDRVIASFKTELEALRSKPR
jgi:SAM-dependent methyltransferase